jgi:hypothetical protein
MKKSPYALMFENLSNLVVNKQIMSVESIDDGLCIKITLLDGAYMIIDTMHTNVPRDAYMPVLQYYSADGPHVDLWEGIS